MVQRYRDAGFIGAIPLPPGQKSPPPDGFTGGGKPYPTDEQIAQWLAGRHERGWAYADGNVGLRLGDVPNASLAGCDLPVVYAGNNVDGWELIGVDVDNYAKGDGPAKAGARELRRLQAEHGELPATALSGARLDTGSCIAVYLVPKGYRFMGKAADGIDIVQKRHRYMVVHPSAHPDASGEGGRAAIYGWRWGMPAKLAEVGADALGAFDGGLPTLADVAVLPEGWFGFLTNGGLLDSDDPISNMTPSELVEWLESRPLHGAEPCRVMKQVTAEHIRKIKSSPDSHTLLIPAHWSVLSLAAEGHAGASVALEKVERAWWKRASGKRAPETLRAEAGRSAMGALGKLEPRYVMGNGEGYVPDDPCAGTGNDKYNCEAVAAMLDSKIGKTANEPAGPRLWSARDLKAAEQPKFLAKNRIPRAAITVLIGEEGIGKSLLWVLIAAAVTTGKPMPELGIPAREPAHVDLVITEDEWSSVVLPRLEVAGADLDYIRVASAEDDGSGSPTFPDDMHVIAEAKPPAAFVVVDAWLDTVSRKLRVGDPQQSRQALHPWKEAGTATGAAMLLLTHSNRLPSNNIRDRYGATASLRMKARATLYCLADGEGNLLVGPDKANGSPGTVKASRFRIQPVRYFDPTPDHDGTVPGLVFDGQSNKTIKQHLADEMAAEKDRARPVSDAERWLLAYLADGERPANEVYHAGAESELELSRDQLKRAKKRVCAPAYKRTNDDRWWWRLLTDDTPPGGDCQGGNSNGRDAATDVANFVKRFGGVGR